MTVERRGSKRESLSPNATLHEASARLICGHWTQTMNKATFSRLEKNPAHFFPSHACPYFQSSSRSICDVCIGNNTIVSQLWKVINFPLCLISWLYSRQGVRGFTCGLPALRVQYITLQSACVLYSICKIAQMTLIFTHKMWSKMHHVILERKICAPQDSLLFKQKANIF